MTLPGIGLRCAGCGARPQPGDPYPFRCPRDGADDTDHVMSAVVEGAAGEFPAEDDPSPFVRYRRLAYSHSLARAHGLADAEYVDLVRRLDRAVAAVDGRGFAATAFGPHTRLGEQGGVSGAGRLWIKDETGNVSGSHKGRHLMGLLIYLEVVDRLGLTGGARPQLAIASCGNAALAAGVVARAGDRSLQVYVPPAAPPPVVARLRALGANIVICPREPGVAGDPTYHRLQAAVRAGAIPFTCQGPSNGLTIDGGKTIGYEIVSELARTGTVLDRVFIQVGGGALASACLQAFEDAVRLGALPRLPKVHAVQTEGAHPIVRAYERLAKRIRLHALPAAPGRKGLGEGEFAAIVAAHADTPAVGDALAYAATHRREFMWPWETEPRSIASGILDDETYDWLAVLRGMIRSGGYPVLASEELLREANETAVQVSGIAVDETGSAGLAGLLAVQRRGGIGPSEQIAVLFTGAKR